MGCMVELGGYGAEPVERIEKSFLGVPLVTKKYLMCTKFQVSSYYIFS